MSEFLEILKVRHAECQKRFQAKQLQVNAVNAEFQAVAQEFNSIQTLMNLEIRKEQTEALTRTATASRQGIATSAVSSVPATLPSQAAAIGEVNKTEIVRELLRQHSSGMTPGEVWKQVKTQISYRPYLYSVLKRLKDKGDITEKRGKYFFKFTSKPEENKEQSMVQ